MADRARVDGVRVLVVDNASCVLDVVTAILEENGAVVTTVDSADAALEALQCTRPDVLLGDLSMPGKGGYWLIGQVRQLPPERGGATPAAALTAFSNLEHRAGVLRAGFQVHVDKPVRMRELVDVVAALAGQQVTRGVDAASSTR
jgi:CheY-like chemotaxis protein